MSQRCSRRESTGPDSHTRLGIREGKIDHKAQATQKGIIQCRLKVGRENGQAVVMLDALQQIANFKVGVTIMAIAHLTALAKQRIRLIKQQNGATGFGCSEHARQVFFSFTNVFAHQCRQIDAVEIELQAVGNYFGRQRLAGAAAPREQRTDPQPTRATPGKTPVTINPVALPHLGDNRLEAGQSCIRQNQVIPLGAADNPFGQLFQPLTRHTAAALPQPCGRWLLLIWRGLQPGGSNVGNLAAREAKLLSQRWQFSGHTLPGRGQLLLPPLQLLARINQR